MFAMGALLLGLGAVVAAFLATLLFFQSEKVNGLVKSLWGLYRKALVYSLGTFAATFSPSFGFGIIVLYYMLRGESMEGDPFMRMVNPVR